MSDGLIPDILPYELLGDIGPLAELFWIVGESPMEAHRAREAVHKLHDVLTKHPKGLNHTAVEMLVSHATQTLVDERPPDRNAVTLLELASVHGYPGAAYNAGNVIMNNMETTADYKRAEDHYQRAIACATDFSLRASAQVNYGMMVRDGPPDGRPDWPGAVELFADAARAGKLVAMHNAAVVSGWIATKKAGGDKGGDHTESAYWCQFALDWINSGKPMLAYDTKDPNEAVCIRNIKYNLAHLHCHDHLLKPDVTYGRRLAAEVRAQGGDPNNYLWRMAVDACLEAYSLPPNSNQLINWCNVLRVLGWEFNSEVNYDKGDALPFWWTQIPHGNGTLFMCMPDIPLFIGSDNEIHREVYDAYLMQCIERFPRKWTLVLPKKAWFLRGNDGQFYTYATLINPRGSITPVTITEMTNDPTDVIKQHGKPWDTLTAQNQGSYFNHIPMVINILSEGLDVIQEFKREVRFVGSGNGFRMPFVRDEVLLRMGILLSGNRVPPDEPAIVPPRKPKTAVDTAVTKIGFQ